MLRSRLAVRFAALVPILGVVTSTFGIPPEKDVWRRADAADFVLLGNVSAGQLAETGRRLVGLRQVLLKATRGLSGQSPLPTYVYAFKSSASFTPYKLGEDGKPRSIAGYFTGSLEGNYAAMDASGAVTPYPILFHEYIHYVIDNNLASVPVWLNEGLAEFYSTVTPASDGKSAQVGLAIQEHLDLLSRAKLLPLASLFAVDQSSPEYNESDRQGVFYAESWALTHWMAVSGDKPGARLSDLLTRLKKGEAADAAFQAAVGMPLEAVEKELQKYVRRSSFTYYSIAFDEALTALTVEAAPMSRAETLYRLGDLLARVAPIQYAEADAHVAAALALEPGNAGALLTKAWLDRSRKRWDAAAASYEAALAKGGPRAKAGYGAMLLERQYAERAQVRPGAAIPAPVLRARELFRQALAQAPDDPLALAGLGETYLFGDTDVSEGTTALMRACMLMPSKKEFLAEWTVLAARSGQLDAAYAALENRLRKGASPELVRFAEQGIAEAEVHRAVTAGAAGNVEGAKGILETAAARLRDPKAKETLAKAQSMLQGVAAEQKTIANYNEGIRAAEQQEWAIARELFQNVATSAEDPALRLAAENALGKLAQAEASQRILDRYDAALTLANDGDIGAAIRAIEALLAEEKVWQPEMRAGVEKTLGSLRSVQKGGKP